jgi:hypothetical protein
MKICENCKGNIASKYGKRFCSQRCSNLFRKQFGFYETVSKRLKEKYNTQGPWGFMTQDSRNKQKTRIYNVLSWEEKVNKRPFNKLSWDYKRRKVILEQNNKCLKCNLDEWMNEKLKLEVNHINGDRSDNTRENLEALCPNCHSLTKNYRGRNKIKGKFPSSKEFYETYKKTGNIRQTLLKYNLAPKGGNYTHAKILLSKEDDKLCFQTEVKFIPR